MLNYLSAKKNASPVTRSVWDTFFTPVSFDDVWQTMKTDVTTTDTDYIFEIELPGYNKEDVKIALDDGYLTVEATKKEEKEESENKTYVRKERFVGTTSRSWYVGNVDQNAIKASFENGILNITVPNKELPVEDSKNYIAID